MSNVVNNETSSVIPESIKDRELLLSLIKESVVIMAKMDVLKEELKEPREVATDENGKLGMKAKAFNALVKAAYNSNKVKLQVKELQDSLDDLSVLINPKKDNQ